MQFLFTKDCPPIIQSDPILILSLTELPIPRKDLFPILTLPPVTAPGPIDEKSSKKLSCSIIDPVFMLQCFPIIVPMLIIEPEIIMDPSPILVLSATKASFEIIDVHLKSGLIFFMFFTIFSLI